MFVDKTHRVRQTLRIMIVNDNKDTALDETKMKQKREIDWKMRMEILAKT